MGNNTKPVAKQIRYKPIGINSTERYLQDKLDDVVSTKDFGKTLSTVSQLQGVTGKDGAVINILGYHVHGDNGGGLFYWDATGNKNTHNGGTIIDPDEVFPTDWTDQTQLTSWFTASNTGVGIWKRYNINEFNIAWFGAKEGEYIDVQLDNALSAINDNGVLLFTNKKASYKISKPHVLVKNCTLKGSGFSTNNIRENNSINYNKLHNLIIDDGIVAFVYGKANGISTQISNYDSGLLVLEGLSSKPNTNNSTGSVFLMYNNDHNLIVKNCIFKYFDAAIDVLGCFGAEIKDNIFVNNNYAIIADPDFNNRDINPDGTISNIETNDLNIFSNTFSGSIIAHIKVNCYGHVLRVHDNSIETSPIGISVSGYSGNLTGWPSRVFYNVKEYSNYYENIGKCIVLGSALGTVDYAEINGSYINAVSNIGGYGYLSPYCEVNRVNHLVYKSGSIYLLSSDVQTYSELSFTGVYSKPIEDSCDIQLRYKYSGTLWVIDDVKQQKQKISIIGLDSSVNTIYVSTDDVKAIAYENNAFNQNKLTDFSAGSINLPFKTFADVTYWLNKTLIGNLVKNTCGQLNIIVSGTLFLNALDLAGVKSARVTTSGYISNQWIIKNCKDLLIENALFKNLNNIYYGQFTFTACNITFNNCTFYTDFTPGFATAWLKIQESIVRFKTPIFLGTGKLHYLARIFDLSTVYSNSVFAGTITTAAPLNLEPGGSANVIAVI